MNIFKNKKFLVIFFIITIIATAGLMFYFLGRNNPILINEVVSNFKDYEGKQISIYAQSLSLLKDPADPQGNCERSQIGCDVVWHYTVSDGSATIFIESAKKLDLDKTKIIRGKFSLYCPLITKSGECKLTDEYCDCHSYVDGTDRRIKAPMNLLID